MIASKTLDDFVIERVGAVDEEHVQVGVEVQRRAERWPTGIACPHCGSMNVQTGAAHKTMPREGMRQAV